MKNVILFLLFILYSTAIFFMPNNSTILITVSINMIIMLIVKAKLKENIKNVIKFLPFILFTVIINYILDNLIKAIWLGIKLLLVCNITYVYSKTTTISRSI